MASFTNAFTYYGLFDEVEGNLSQVMIEHIQPAVFDQIDSGELHDLPDLIFIVTPVALGITLLAHGFGIVRALHPHG